MKTCSLCKECKENSEFHSRTLKSGAQSLQSRCKTCNLKENKSWHTKARRKRNQHIKHGLTDISLNRLLTEQNNACSICNCNFNENNKYVVDHDHSCCPGKFSCGQCVRGLLCKKCNWVVGVYELGIMDKVANYLMNYGVAAARRSLEP